MAGSWLRGRMLAASGVLAVWTAAWGWYLAHEKPFGSWFFFEKAVRLLFSDQGLAFYRKAPELQFGPVPTLLAAPFVALGRDWGAPVATTVMALVGLVVLAVATATRDTADRLVPAPLAYLGYGLLAMPVWADLCFRNAHFDDAWVLLFAVFALEAMRRDKPTATALLLGLAVDCKPWALAFAPLLFGVSRRNWLQAHAVYFATIAIAWLPFFVAEPRSLRMTGFALKVDGGSTLALLGLTGEPMPSWVRPGQVLLGVAAGLVLVKFKRYRAVLFAAVVARILLDPAIHNYYAAGAVMAAVVADRALVHRVPWLTLGTTLGLWLPRRGPWPDLPDAVTSWQHLIWGVVMLVAVLVSADRARRVARASEDESMVALMRLRARKRAGRGSGPGDDVDGPPADAPPASPVGVGVRPTVWD